MIIKKHKDYINKLINLQLDEERDKSFNEGEVIEVTEEELEKIGKHRWLEILGEQND